MKINFNDIFSALFPLIILIFGFVMLVYSAHTHDAFMCSSANFFIIIGYIMILTNKLLDEIKELKNDMR